VGSAVPSMGALVGDFVGCLVGSPVVVHVVGGNVLPSVVVIVVGSSVGAGEHSLAILACDRNKNGEK
jgi:hypothetical protein